VRALANNNEDPDKANRPFDKDRTGFLSSVKEEGRSFLIGNYWSPRPQPRRRIYAESWATARPATLQKNIMMMENSGTPDPRMLQACLSGRRISAGEIDYINSHGIRHPMNLTYRTLDSGERIEHVFRKERPHHSTKSLIGPHPRELPRD